MNVQIVSQFNLWLGSEDSLRDLLKIFMLRIKFVERYIAMFHTNLISFFFPILQESYTRMQIM